MKKTVAFCTLGCKVNQYETDAMRGSFEAEGYEVKEFSQEASVYVINTCTVTNMADRKSRQMLHRAKKKNPEGIIVAVGCYVQAAKEQLEEDTMIDLVIGNNMKSQVVQIVEQYIRDNRQTEDRDAYVADIAHDHEYEAMHIETVSEHTRAYIKIQDGCNQFCSYCIIPYARGRVRSKSLEDLKAELIQVAANGYREVVLVGINLSAYGLDEDFDLADAVECACSVDGIDRVRLGSIEPERMDKEMIARLAAQPKFCPQFHLSLQSGCDNTLKAMNRHYNCSEYAEIVTNLRNAFENSSMTTDVMVGFAGETEEDFNASLKFVKSIGFAKVHIFPYSRRKGTVADKAPNQIDPQIKEQRAKIMEQVCDETRREFLKDQVGLCESVLVERLRHGYLEGYTKNYTPVHINSEDTSLCGKIIDVKITKSFDDYCDAELV